MGRIALKTQLDGDGTKQVTSQINHCSGLLKEANLAADNLNMYPSQTNRDALYSAIRKLKVEANRVDKLRLAAEAPIKEFLAAWKQYCYEQAKPYFGEIDRLAKIVTDYDAEVARVMAERLAAQRAAEEKQRAEAEKQAKLEADPWYEPPAQVLTASPTPAPPPEPVEKGVRTSWAVEIEDITKVPMQYLNVTLNNAAVRDALKNGVTKIPGLKLTSSKKLV